MRARFRQTSAGSVFDCFFLLQQISSVPEYRSRFEALAAAVGDMAELALQAAFLKGLRPEIQAALCVLEPNGLLHMMELAEVVEVNLSLGRTSRAGPLGPTRAGFVGSLPNLQIPEHSKPSGLSSTTRLSSSPSASRSLRRPRRRCRRLFAG